VFASDAGTVPEGSPTAQRTAFPKLRARLKMSGLLAHLRNPYHGVTAPPDFGCASTSTLHRHDAAALASD
jgi:hypothetical protein